MSNLTPEIISCSPGMNFAWMTVENIGDLTDRSALNRLKENQIRQLRLKHHNYERSSYIQTDQVRPYINYYRSFAKTYPVLLQLESIVMKNKPLPAAGAPVEVMFLAEIEHMLLTAGHDLSKIQGQLTVQAAEGTESYHTIADKAQMLTKGDHFLSDEAGILSSILGGPDERTKITPATREVLYFVYGTEGITRDRLQEHLETIAGYLTAVLPGSKAGPVMISPEQAL